MRVFIFLAFVTLVAASRSPKTVNRIVGGSATTVEQYPFMANLQFGFGTWWIQFCGGSLITNYHILTAAHCVESMTTTLYRVVLGSSLTSGAGGTEYLVSSIKIHERYDDPLLDNDIAIMRLQTPAVFSQSVQATAIASMSYILEDGDTVTAIGYGTLSSGGASPIELQHVDMDVINQELCAERYAYLKSQPGFERWPDITDGMICAGILDVGGKDACQGDSGGPVVHDGSVIIGITSWGYGCGDPVYPGVSARVQYYSDWIIENAV